MNKRISSTGNKRVTKYQLKTLAMHREKSQYITIVTPKTESVQEQIVVRYKPVVRKLGKNNIEMVCISEIKPIAFDVSPTFKVHKINPRLRKIAQLMKKSSIAGIRRIGFDIIDD